MDTLATFDTAAATARQVRRASRPTCRDLLAFAAACDALHAAHADDRDLAHLLDAIGSMDNADGFTAGAFAAGLRDTVSRMAEDRRGNDSTAQCRGWDAPQEDRHEDAAIDELTYDMARWPVRGAAILRAAGYSVGGVA